MCLRLHLISKPDFVHFFAEHSIPLNGEKHFTKKLASEASTLGEAFSVFLYTLTNRENKLLTSFDNFEEAYECFKYFVAGYTKEALGIN